MISLIEKMSEFAMTTKNDTLSIAVSKVIARLENQNALFETPLTKREMTIIAPFLQSQNEKEV